MKDLLIIGAGGLGRQVAWLVERMNQKNPEWNLLGFLDDNPNIAGEKRGAYTVIGQTENCLDYPDAWVVCAVGSSQTRQSIINKVKLSGIKQFATLIDPSALHPDNVSFGEGCIISAYSILNVDISVGEHVFINTDCTVGHDAILGNFVTLSPSVNVAGYVVLNECVEMGMGSQIIQGKRVGKNSVIGAGSVVVKDIPEKCTAVGIPAKPIKYSD